MKVHKNIFARIITPENLFQAWEEFRRGKGTRKDVQAFEWQLEQNILSLCRDLRNRTYRHGEYSAFSICDPKQRRIHKATVRDRILHHAIFKVLNPIFEPTFIAHSFSCREGKGTHKAVDALEIWLRKVSRNNRKSCFALKCDIHQFFASVDHAILLSILSKKIKDADAMRLLIEIVESFRTPGQEGERSKGIPIGNLTSQLFANVYLNEFDQFMKHTMHVRHYVRYTDDFVIVDSDRSALENLIPAMQEFLSGSMNLKLHPRKIILRKFGQGIDFLGYVVLPHHRTLRTRTKKRMFRKLKLRVVNFKKGSGSETSVECSLQSYLGVLSHANTEQLSEELKNQCWFWMCE
jgi:RNA-directed DNA polymerase